MHTVRREGNVLTRLSVCPQGGYPYPIMLCNITQNAMGQPGGTLPGPAGRGVPCPGGYPAQGGPCQVQPGRGWYPARSSQGGYPAWGGVPCPLGYPVTTTEGVLTTQRAVCLLRSRRSTFLLCLRFNACFTHNIKLLRHRARHHWDNVKLWRATWRWCYNWTLCLNSLSSIKRGVTLVTFSWWCFWSSAFALKK